MAEKAQPSPRDPSGSEPGDDSVGGGHGGASEAAESQPQAVSTRGGEEKQKPSAEAATGGTDPRNAEMDEEEQEEQDAADAVPEASWMRDKFAKAKETAADKEGSAEQQRLRELRMVLETDYWQDGRTGPLSSGQAIIVPVRRREDRWLVPAGFDFDPAQALELFTAFVLLRLLFVLQHPEFGERPLVRFLLSWCGAAQRFLPLPAVVHRPRIRAVSVVPRHSGSHVDRARQLACVTLLAFMKLFVERPEALRLSLERLKDQAAVEETRRAVLTSSSVTVDDRGDLVLTREDVHRVAMFVCNSRAFADTQVCWFRPGFFECRSSFASWSFASPPCAFAARREVFFARHLASLANTFVVVVVAVVARCSLLVAPAAAAVPAAVAAPLKGVKGGGIGCCCPPEARCTAVIPPTCAPTDFAPRPAVQGPNIHGALRPQLHGPRDEGCLPGRPP